MKKFLSTLTASARDIVLAGVAAASGYLLAVEVLPKTSTEFKAILSAAVYMGIRAAVAYAVGLVTKK